jgi:hypothetical protein
LNISQLLAELPICENKFEIYDDGLLSGPWQFQEINNDQLIQFISKHPKCRWFKVGYSRKNALQIYESPIASLEELEVYRVTSGKYVVHTAGGKDYLQTSTSRNALL